MILSLVECDASVGMMVVVRGGGGGGGAVVGKVSWHVENR